MKYGKINGIKIFAPSSRGQLLNFALEQKRILIAINAEKILHATDDTRLLINANIGYPDGIGTVFALRDVGIKDAQKIPGCEFWLDVIRAQFLSKTFYLVGGKEEVVNETVRKLRHEFDGINILNYRNGYLQNERQVEDLVLDISNKKPDIVFVAMGSPKQEKLMERMQKQHRALFIGLGGSFDIFVGDKKRAPVWWRKNNLEWLYRLISEPRRIKRQIYLVKFLVLLVLRRFD